MKIRRISLAVTTVAVLAICLFVGTPVTPTANASGANVYRDFACGISLAPIGGGFIITSDTHAVVTPTGNTQFKCTGDIPPGLEPPTTVRVVGLGCFTQGGFTPDSVNLYTPGGKAQLTCNINPHNQ